MSLKVVKFSSYKDTRPLIIRKISELIARIRAKITETRKNIRRSIVQQAKAELVDEFQGLMLSVLYEACKEWREESDMSIHKNRAEFEIKHKFKEIVNRYVNKNANKNVF
jgi:hypothetical protein